jgi:putative two-component system response regulator
MNSSKKCILIVDDEPQNLAALNQILSPTYQVVIAPGGEEAIALVAKYEPNLILLDIKMPGMDGIEVCRRLKADPKVVETPVIFVTALGEVDDETAGFNAGAVDYIVKPLSPPIVLARVATHLSLVRAVALESSYRAAIHMLGEAGHFNDSDTGAHIWRMAAYARVLASAIGWTDEQCDRIGMAATMHDTGKLGIPDTLLQKPGKLDAAEWVTMRKHCQIGFDILSKSSSPVFRLAAEIALYHHEKWDGSGYPIGKSGDAIPESARIVALADVFDALTMKRPYKEAWPLEKVLDTLREGSGKHFDPRLVDVFLAHLPEILEAKDYWTQTEVA